MHRAALLFLLSIVGLLAPGAVMAQVKRCTAADGTLVYTDRKCDDIGATERVGAMPSAGGAIAGRYRNVCARTVQDLVYSFSNALQSGDANQVAGVYDWAGMPTSTAYNVMTRLEAIAKRPLIDVQPMYSGDTNAYGDDIVTFDETTGEVVTRASILQLARDRGLRVEERKVSLDEWRDGVASGDITEAFACGTAAVITPIGELKGEGFSIGDASAPAGDVTMAIRKELTDIQYGRLPDRHGWLVRLR